MASKKPAWLANAEAKDAKGQTAVSQSANYKNNNSYGNGTTNTATTSKVGNYTIGSDAGKNQAQNMAIGTNWYNANDGSTWKKEMDGTITVNHNGTTSRNAYVPSDLGILGQQQMAAGVPYQYVMATDNARQNKAWTTPGLEQFAGDAIHQQAQNYIYNQMKAQNQPQYTTQQLYQWFDNSKPTYEDKYDAQIDAQLDKILNRDGFSYDAADDPLYAQYQQMYQREGDRAMRETLAEAAASAGGMNSYAITAAQQANNYYNAQLADKIPELYQLAYEMYVADKNDEIQNLGILQNMSDSQYARYMDTMDNWYNDRNFAYGMYQDDVANGQWQTQFDYNAMQNDRDFNFMVSDAYNQNNRYNEETAYEREQAEKADAIATIDWLIEGGASFESIGADLIAKSGLTESAIRERIANKQGNFNRASSGNGGGGNGTVPAGNPGEEEPTLTQSQFNQTVERLRGYPDVGIRINLNGKVDASDLSLVSKVVTALERDNNLTEEQRFEVLARMGIDDDALEAAMLSPYK